MKTTWTGGTVAAGAFVAALLCALPTGPVAAQGAQASTVKDLLGNLWARLRAATPRSSPPPAATSVTAGLRGSEATESELKPYWKGDREQDASSRTERQALESAQALADAGKFAEAARAYDAFLQQNARSTLAPNALFGSALARAALGDKARASAAFEEFIKRDPQHPLAKDAEQALAALR
jgi:TolA-binding protein